jgi:hypothetical protein
MFSFLILFLLIACGFALLVGLVLWIVTWTTHIHMNKSEAKQNKIPYGWSTYLKFLDNFYKYNGWTKKDIWDRSLFANNHDEYDNFYIHAEIIKIDKKCMILDPISYLKFKLFMRETCKANQYKPEKINW